VVGQFGGCGNAVRRTRPNPSYQNCYPPAVNYTPLYYLINGSAFDQDEANAAPFPRCCGDAGHCHRTVLGAPG